MKQSFLALSVVCVASFITGSAKANDGSFVPLADIEVTGFKVTPGSSSLKIEIREGNRPVVVITTRGRAVDAPLDSPEVVRISELTPSGLRYDARTNKVTFTDAQGTHEVREAVVFKEPRRVLKVNQQLRPQDILRFGFSRDGNSIINDIAPILPNLER